MSDTPSVTPRHIALIMDGNARWASARKRPVAYGHRQGAEALKLILKPCADLGVECLSVYAFSEENWQRPEDEVSELMGLLDWYLKRELSSLLKHDIRLHISGDMSRLSPKLAGELAQASEQTRHGNALILNVCLSYGARQELAKVCRELASACQTGRMSPEEIDSAAIDRHLYTSSLPEPDLLIRTGGEQRLSNFLLWQCAYAELYFTDVLWPDFDSQHLHEACEAFATRERRYGKR